MNEFLKGVWTIVRREVSAQFGALMTYIFIVVFLFISTGLYMFLPPFFAFPTADMSGFFGWIVPMLCIFAPAATMRIWAEDRRENTIELLLTFPISSSALVAAKFIAAFVFYLAAVASTVMIPIMLAVLGEPDWGVIFSGYFGMVLLGGFFIALGMFVSGFCKDQVTAFVLSFMACGVVTLFGWEPFVNILSGSLGGLGEFLSSALGMTVHYVPFARGVIDFGDILYFVVWTVLLLFLNGVFLEGRSRPNVHATFAGIVSLGFFIGIMFNLLFAGASIVRVDMTENQSYTVSEATQKILGGLSVPVRVNYYVTAVDKLPAELRNLERDVVDKLTEISVASGKKLTFKVMHLDAANVMRPRDIEEEEKEEKDDKEKSLEERLLDKGIKPFSVRALRQDESTTKFIYSSLGIAYKEKEEEIVPQIVPQMLPELEYRLVSTAYKLSCENPPTIALIAPFEEMKIPPHVLQMYMQMGRQPPQQDDPYEMVNQLLSHEKFTVKRVKLEKGDGMPEDFDALIVISPRELNERQKWEINRALVEGKPTLIAAQNYKWNYSVNRDRVNITKVEEKPGINEILQKSGIRIDERILMDKNQESLTVSGGGQNPLERLFGGGVTLKLPLHVVVNASSMNPNVSITSRIGRLFYLWGSALKLDEQKVKESKLEMTTLLSSSDGAWLVPSSEEITKASTEPPEKTEQYPLAVMAKGQFVDAYPGKERPKWPDTPPSPGMPPQPPAQDDDAPAKPIKPAPGKLIVVGCGQMLNKNFLAGGNMDFFMNSVDALTLGEDLIHIRAKKPIDRTIDKPSEASRSFWKIMVMFFVATVVIASGVTRLVLVRRARENYRAALRVKKA